MDFFLMPLYHLALQIEKAHTKRVGLYPPKPLAPEDKRVPPYWFMLCQSHPLQIAALQRFFNSLYLYTARACGFCFDVMVPAMRNCVSNGVRTSRCRADFFRLTKSRCGLPSRRAPDRLAALLTAFRLIYRVLPAPGFNRWGRPSPTIAISYLMRTVMAYKRLVLSALRVSLASHTSASLFRIRHMVRTVSRRMAVA